MSNKVFEEAAKKERESKEKNKEEQALKKKNETLIVAPLSESKKKDDEIKEEDEFIEPEENYNETNDEVIEESRDDIEREDDNSESQGDRLIIEPVRKDSQSENSDSGKSVSPLEAIEGAIEESGIKNMLTDTEEEVVDNYIKNSKVPGSVSGNSSQDNKKSKEPDMESTAKMAAGVLGKFKDYITSDKFDKTCEDAAKKHGVKKNIVKSKMISGFLGTIADTLGLTIKVGGDIILGAVGFISAIIERIVEFAVDSLLKLVSVLTLNCGDVINS